MTRTLILLRHGQSQWNLENRFTGWVDVDLSDQGRVEARRAGALMREAGLVFDAAHTSLLKRAIRTLWIALDEMDQMWVPVERSWQLNERHYGALQGLDKSETAQQHGADQVQVWRRSFDVPPPPLPADDPGHPSQDRRYHVVPPEALPAAESLKTTLDRVLPYWTDRIVPQIAASKTVLVAAHGNSLRALYMHLNGISEQDIVDVNIPTGIPLRVELAADLTVRSQAYLGDPEEATRAAAAVANQAARSSP